MVRFACVKEWEFRQTKLDQESESKVVEVVQVEIQEKLETGQKQ